MGEKKIGERQIVALNLRLFTKYICDRCKQKHYTCNYCFTCLIQRVLNSSNSQFVRN